MEQKRLTDWQWKKWGSYVSDRQWGTVREDYSATGNAWGFTTHDDARSRAWRWGEEGIGGISDDQQHLCFALALWNKQDPFLKERFFGLTNQQGNHGEDVKELYYYLDATPTHSYMKMLYKYPMRAFPYEELVTENGRRGKEDTEYELVDTGIFDKDEYFDVFIEYAKADREDILVKITVHNRSKRDAPLNIVPTIWFRNTWCWGRHNYKPHLQQINDHAIEVQHKDVGVIRLYCQEGAELLYCDNETNYKRVNGLDVEHAFPKDGINDYIVDGAATVNPHKQGTKAAANYDVVIPAGDSVTIKLRLCPEEKANAFADFDALFKQRIKEADDFYADLQEAVKVEEERMIQRQALAGMLWNKQFYEYKVQQWLDGDPDMPSPPPERKTGRNHDWRHLYNSDIISVPDKWEFPWYAAWDLAFHAVSFTMVDPDFAKNQLQLLTEEWYMHPSGALPAYEWSFGDANPPVHAGAVYRIFMQDAKYHGKKDYRFLESMFHKLLINFTWWVNRKDRRGSNIFEGGFLGLDNIGVIDRSAVLPEGIIIEQADGTSWMAMYALNMLHIALELATYNKVYTSMANKFFEHFLYIAGAMASMGADKFGLWDDDDNFFYDQLRKPDGSVEKLKVRSLVGLIPLFAVEVITHETLQNNPAFARRMDWFFNHRPDLARLVSNWKHEGYDEKHLLTLLRGHRMKLLLKSMLDETEFLSEYGIRSLSKRHLKEPYSIQIGKSEFSISYVPGESDGNFYGGNSNWRGPIWMPMNYLIIESLRKFHYYYSDDFLVEYPTGSGQKITLLQIADELTKRLLKIFMLDRKGRRPVFGEYEKMQGDPHFRDYILFNEYFHGDSGKGLGASHQTGWTGIVANLIAMKNPHSRNEALGEDTF